MSDPKLLELKNIVKKFPVRRGFFGRTKEFVHAVNDISLAVEKGEVLGLVGESGCGKSTLGRLVLRLYKPTGGQIVFGGTDITNASGGALKNVRRRLQVIFQDPFSSLNPRMSVGDIISELLLVHGLCKGKERFERASELLSSVGLDPSWVYRYPHEFSGGQRQRICIARAIALKPDLIVADEPVSSLDVAVQADILNLLKKLHEEHNMAFLFISHDLRVVSKFCNRTAVMYLGKVVERFESEKIHQALHPYTCALLSSVPVPDPSKRKKPMPIAGDVPSAVNLPNGCYFHPRCPYKKAICEKVEPVLEEKEKGHFAACHFTTPPRKPCPMGGDEWII